MIGLFQDQAWAARQLLKIRTHQVTLILARLDSKAKELPESNLSPPNKKANVEILQLQN